jgi:hypothetical protein
MEDLGQNPVILPPQIIEKPTSVTVFGILNCVFGGLALLCTPFSILGLFVGDILPTGQPQMEMAPAYKGVLLVSSILGIGFAAWLLALGIGLLKMKRWARRGSVIYSCIAIAWAIAGVALNIIAMTMQWITIPEQGLPGFIGGICGGLCGGLIYPILLLIFMQSAKVKRAFAVIGGE